MIARRYAVVIEQTGTGYSAYSPDVSGCVAVGDTEEETRRNFQDALIERFEALREAGEQIPEPRTSVDYVDLELSVAEGIKDTSMGRPHVVILGARCSLAAFPTGDREGRRLPLMNNLVQVLGLEALLKPANLDDPPENFEALYSRRA